MCVVTGPWHVCYHRTLACVAVIKTGTMSNEGHSDLL